MKHKIRIIKHGERKPKEPEPDDRQEQPSRQSTREITGTIKRWVSEFKERRALMNNIPETPISWF
jgi:hypothetical protein